MKRSYLSMAVLAVMVIAGCSGGESAEEEQASVLSRAEMTPVSGEAAPGKVSDGNQANADLLGEWKLQIPDFSDQSSDSEAGELGDKMAEAMAGMMAAMLQMELEFKDASQFEMTVMGMDIEGNYTRDGRDLELNAEKIMGMTKEEWAKSEMNGEDGVSMNMDEMNEPLLLRMSEDGKSIEMLDEESDEQMFFVRK